MFKYILHSVCVVQIDAEDTHFKYILHSVCVVQIDAEEYGEALALAQAYSLDCDLVYQRQWRRSPVSLASIQDYLVSQWLVLCDCLVSRYGLCSVITW